MPKPNELLSVTSIGSHKDIQDHEIDLQAITSQVISIGDVGADFTTDQKFFILKRMNYEGLVSLDNLPVEVLFMIEKIQALPVEEAIVILKEAIEEHKDDVNVSIEDIELFQNLVDSTSVDFPPPYNKRVITEKSTSGVSTENKAAGLDESLDAVLEAPQFDYHIIFDWTLQVKVEAALIAYHSPYPEVRAVTDPFDDPEQPCETLRAYIIGFVWCAIGTFINQFFSERQPSITFSSSVAQLFIYPSGELLAFILPKWSFSLFGVTVDLNPGKWNFKEQMFSTIIFSVAGGGTSYVSSNIIAQKSPLFYNNKWVSWGYQILLILSTNFLGFGFAGILRRFSVYPVKALWPSILPTLALNRALTRPTKKENVNGWTISRYWFFITTVTASFLYFWFPDYIFQALSVFNWMTWISPKNSTLAIITGSVSGLGLNPITSFDWNTIGYNSALWVPFYSQVNQYIGSIIGFFCITAVYYTNYKWSGYLPINSNSAFSNTGDSYSVEQILNADGLLDDAKYQSYGPPFYTAANLVLYGAFFAIYPFSVIYETLNNYKTYYSSFKSIFKSVKNFRNHSSVYEDQHDPHSTMMARYKEVPDWCFLVVLIVSIVLAIVMVEVFPRTETPVWSIFFAAGINFVFLIPLTMIYATTGFSFGLNVLVELIVGYAIPNNGQALMIVKAFGYNIDGQAQNYISDQKMAHYAKIPPRAIFRGQLISVLMSSFITLAIVNWQLDSVEDYCAPHQKDKFTCPGSTTFFVASVIWGVIGPKKVFSGLYPILQWCFLIGALLAPICWALKFYFPKKLKYFQPTLIIGGILIYAPYNLSYYTMGLYVSFIFMYYLRKYYMSWWNKYNYVLSGGLDAGVAFAGVIIFFAVQYHDKSIDWWGNNVSYAGVDGLGPVPIKNITDAPDGYFGPRIGNFP